MKTAWFIALLCIAFSAPAQNTSQKKWTPPNTDSVCKSLIGKPFTTFDLKTIDGKHLNNESFKGKVTLIDFWFEGCAPCREEIGMLNELYDNIRTNPSFQFVAVTFDSPESVTEFIAKKQIGYPVASVSEQEILKMKYGLGYPAKAIIGPDGNYCYIGMAQLNKTNGHYLFTIPTLLNMMRSCAAHR